MVKKVNLVIKVPSGDYCWSWTGKKELCSYFDNSHRADYCDLFGVVLRQKSGKGVKKCKQCLALKEVEK